MIYSTVGRIALIVGLGMVVDSSPLQAEIQAAEVGRTHTVSCVGPWVKKIVHKVAWVKDGIIRFEGTYDERTDWLEKPVSLIGATLFSRRDRGDGKGVRTMSFDMDDFAGYTKLSPGSTFSGTSREKHATANWQWGHEITVGATKTIDHPVLGKIEVTEISEKRQVWGGSYTSESKALVYPKGGISVHTEYKDKDGQSVCNIVANE